MTKDKEPTPSKRELEWALEIGRFVMAFGSIEAFTYAQMRQSLRDGIGEILIQANTQFGTRLDVLIAAAYNRSGKDWDQLANVLERIKALVGKRNIIAHNGVTFDMFIDPAGELEFEEVISNRRVRGNLHQRLAPKHRIPFDELVKRRKEIEALDRELLRAIEDVTDVD